MIGADLRARGAPVTARLPAEGGFFAAEALFVLFNVLDAFFTLLFVGRGVAIESNPLLAQAIAVSPLCFVLTKAFLAGGAAAILHSLRRQPAARIAMSAAAAAYAFIVVWHLAHLPLGA